MTRKIRRPQSIPNHPETTVPYNDPKPSYDPETGEKTEHRSVELYNAGQLREIQTEAGLPPIEKLEDEIEHYIDVLMGRMPPPMDAGVLTLMEVADAYFARGCEIQYHILKAEREGHIFASHSYAKFRKGQLRTFLELTKRAQELGSRRLTMAKYLHDMAGDADGLHGFYNED
jgi:hypothetical protein